VYPGPLPWILPYDRASMFITAICPVQPHRIVKEGEQEHERRVGTGRLGKEGQTGRGDPLPVAFTVYGRIFACGPLKDGVHEPSGVRYGDARAGTHASCQRVGRGTFAEPPT
jgi:hypothetical protein